MKIRTKKPSKKYSRYQGYKRFLREEFDYSCVYCDVREGELGGSKSFQIDHYKPKSQFPDDETVYENLYYACRDCNGYKGSYWPTPGERKKGEFILNPCDHDLGRHLDKGLPEWKGSTREGLWNIKKLRLNSKARQKIRTNRLVFEGMIVKLENNRNKALQALSECVLPKAQRKHKELEKYIQDIKGELDALRYHTIRKLD